MTDGDKTYETIVLPRALTAQILKMAHDDLGHNFYKTCDSADMAAMKILPLCFIQIIQLSCDLPLNI